MQATEKGRGKHRRRPPSPTDEDNASSGPDPASTSSDLQNKRKRGQGGRNHYPEGRYTINEISAAGEPIEPPKIATKFRTAIGAIIRTKMVLDPKITNWTLVPQGNKGAMWGLLSTTFVLPKGTTDKIKYYAMKMLGESFRRWKSN